MHYKWLTTDRMTTYQHTTWPSKARVWTPAETPRLCVSGWHLATHEGIGSHARIGAVLWEAEGRGKSVGGDDKTAFASARLLRQIGVLDRQIAVQWAAECAKRVLKHYEDRYPKDKRPRDAINAALAWAKNPTEKNRAANANANAAAAANAAAYADAAAYVGAAAAYVDVGAAAAAAAAYADVDVGAAAAAAYAASAAAYVDVGAAAAAAAARRKEREWQSDRLLELIGGAK